MTSIQQTSSPSCPIANAASLRFVLESFIRPERAARFLEHHQVIRSAELRWSSLKNGELLLAAERDGFEVLVTADRNLAYQQNLQARTIAIVVLPSGRWPEIEPHASAVATAVDDAKPGHYIEIPAFTPEPLQEIGVRRNDLIITNVGRYKPSKALIPAPGRVAGFSAICRECEAGSVIK